MILVAAILAVLILCAVLWFAGVCRDEVCACPNDCEEHPTEGTAS